MWVRAKVNYQHQEAIVAIFRLSSISYDFVLSLNVAVLGRKPGRGRGASSPCSSRKLHRFSYHIFAIHHEYAALITTAPVRRPRRSGRSQCIVSPDAT